MIVHQLQVGGMHNFTYIAEDEGTSEAVVIDPSWDLAEIELVIQRRGLRITHIINTHHHFDHTLGNAAMAESTGARIVQHELSGMERDVAVSDGDVISFGGSELRVVHTPGHSQDSICLVGDGKVFTGDTLFVGNCGRTDLPGGDARQLYRSLFGPVYAMDDSLVVYPGHNYGASETSTIGREKETNPVLRRVTEDEFAGMMGR